MTISTSRGVVPIQLQQPLRASRGYRSRVARRSWRAALLVRDYMEAAETTNADCPLVLSAGRLANVATNAAYDVHSKRPECRFGATQSPSVRSRV
jgi:hypothetical protein